VPLWPLKKTNHAEALRRIQKAAQTRATQLDLKNLFFLKRIPPDLERLTSLQTLDFSMCYQPATYPRWPV
jgi:hypothetical protein